MKQPLRANVPPGAVQYMTERAFVHQMEVYVRPSMPAPFILHCGERIWLLRAPFSLLVRCQFDDGTVLQHPPCAEDPLLHAEGWSAEKYLAPMSPEVQGRAGVAVERSLNWINGPHTHRSPAKFPTKPRHRYVGHHQVHGGEPHRCGYDKGCRNAPQQV